MDQTELITQLSCQINIVLRLAAAAYDQTVLLKQAVRILAETTPMDAEREARIAELLRDVEGAEQEAAHAMRLMLVRPSRPVRRG